MKFLWDFLAISGYETQFQERIAPKTVEIGPRHRQDAHEIFSIVRRFRGSKSRFSRFKETCALEHQTAVFP